MRRNSFQTGIRIFSLVLLVGLFGCNESWWTRGQPPSVKTLIERSESRFDEAVLSYGSKREDILDLANNLKSNLIAASVAASKGAPKAELLAPLKKAEENMIAVENSLSIGSRAAYGELSGQLRVFVNTMEKGGEINGDSVGLYVSRVLFFLANELSVPAPVA